MVVHEQSYRDAVGRVAAAVRSGRLAILAGAGISMGRSSNLPRWSELVYGMLDALRPSSSQSSREVLAGDEEHLLNEVILHVLDTTVGRSVTVGALKACFDTSSFSPIHRCFAEMATTYGTN